MTTPGYQESTKQVLDRCELIVNERHEVAERLKIQASALIGRPRQQLLGLSGFFASNISSMDLLRHPGTASITRSILDVESTRLPIAHGTPLNWDDSIRGVSMSLDFGPSRIAMILTQLMYPLVLLLACGLLTVFYSVWLVPEFEQMFYELELEIPYSTRTVITVASWIRNLGPYVLGVAVCAVFYQLTVWLSSRMRMSPMKLVDSGRHRFENAKATWAHWAWHVATLLEIGVDPQDAIQIAGDNSGQRWMKGCCDDWATRLRRGDNPFVDLSQVNGVPIASIGQAMRLASINDQAAMLRVAALNYRDVNRSQTLWWWTWLTPITVVLVATLCGWAFVAMMSPLIQLIGTLA